jgi:alpha-glucosidase/alpha-D-xyloside xylohydrolase
VLGGFGVGVAQLLFNRQLLAAGMVAPQVGEPGIINLSLTSLTPRVLRISIAPVNAAPSTEELGVVDRGRGIAVGPPVIAGDEKLDWGKYRVEVQENPLRIAVSEEGRGLRQEIQFDPYSTGVRFRVGNAPLFGLGEGVHPFDRRGTRDTMRNGQFSPDLDTFGARVPVPWLISAEGWGIFVGEPLGTVDLTGPMGLVRSPVATSTRNVYLILGDTPANILHGYAELTGFPHLPPLWALGYQQSHRTLASREEILGEAKTFREKKLPCDALIYLGTGFCPSGWNTGHGSFAFNANVFPDPKVIFNQLHADHFNVVLHVVPPYDLHGSVADSGSAVNSLGDAVGYWAKHMPVEEAGVDGWWPDEGDGLAPDARLERNQMYWDGPRKVHPDRRPFALHRNGYAGIQRFGWIWSGDIESTWKTLAAQVMVGINMGLSGIPYWGTDTGGFYPTAELTPELYVRWFQFGAFCPLFRCHGRAWKLRLPWGWNLGEPGPLEGTQDGNPNWPPEKDLHNAEVETICRKYLNLRYQLLPYLYSSVEQGHRVGLPLMRALWITWPDDERASLVDDSYLWGDSILVAPVLEKAATERKTYLPAGVWWDYWTGEQVKGAGEVTRDVDLETIPLYVRAGAIIPTGAVRQYAMEPNDEPVTLKVYPGADGRFSWYHDDGESFRYEAGEFVRIECRWDDAGQTLHLIRDPHGRLPAPGHVRVEVIGKGNRKTVTLTGPTTTVQM